MSNLVSGFYTINNVTQKSDNYVGRFKIEDFSLNPKRVVAVTSELGPPRLLIQKSDGKYTIRADGAPIGVEGGQVVAYLVTEEMAKKWDIIQADGAGPGVYTIIQADGTGWVLPDTKPQTQVACKPLSSGGQKNQLWRIVQLTDN